MHEEGDWAYCEGWSYDVMQQHSNFSVMIWNLPVDICEPMCMDALLHRAHLNEALVGYISDDRQTAITYSDWWVAMRCALHFQTSVWAATTVTVCIVDARSGSVVWHPQGAYDSENASAVTGDVEDTCQTTGLYGTTAEDHLAARASAYAHARAARNGKIASST